MIGAVAGLADAPHTDNIALHRVKPDGSLVHVFPGKAVAVKADQDELVGVTDKTEPLVDVGEGLHYLLISHLKKVGGHLIGGESMDETAAVLDPRFGQLRDGFE